MSLTGIYNGPSAKLISGNKDGQYDMIVEKPIVQLLLHLIAILYESCLGWSAVRTLNCCQGNYILPIR